MAIYDHSAQVIQVKLVIILVLIFIVEEVTSTVRLIYLEVVLIQCRFEYLIVALHLTLPPG